MSNLRLRRSSWQGNIWVVSRPGAALVFQGECADILWVGVHPEHDDAESREPVQHKPHDTVRSSHEGRPSWDVRDRPDRRQQPTPALSRYTVLGSRRRNRRATDPSRRYHVDRADGSWLRALLVIVALIVLDATLTLHILANGGAEVNPIMNWVYGQGWGWFMTVKVLTAVIAFPTFTAHRYFRIARLGAAAILVAYGGVMLVHLQTLLKIYL